MAPGCAGRPLTTSQAETGLEREAQALAWRGEWDEARRLIERGLADATSRGDRVAEARLLLRRGKVAIDDVRHRGGDPGSATADLTAARALAEAAGDRELVADSIDSLGMSRYVHWYDTQDPADLAGAEAMFRDALAMREPTGASTALVDSHFHVALIYQMRGDRDAARGELERAQAIAAHCTDDGQFWHVTRHLGELAAQAHDWPTAERFYQQSLALRERQGPGPGLAAAQVALAEMRYDHDGAAGPALALLARAHDGAAASHSVAYTAIASAAIGRIHRDLGAYDEARRWFSSAITVTEAIHSDEHVPENYERLALIGLLAGQPSAALADAERGIAHRASSRLQALQALAQARVSGQPAAAAPPAGKDAVLEAQQLLAAGAPDAALEAAIRGDDPDTLLLAARAVGPDGVERAGRAAAAMSRAQELRFARERIGLVRR
jgi:tetratricopeptide (TPR) repeat protein